MALLMKPDLPRILVKIMTLLTAIIDMIDQVARSMGLRKIPQPEVICSDFTPPDIALQATIEELEKSLPVLRFGDADLGKTVERQCSVCLNCLQDEEMVRKMPHCQHAFHKDCIDSWLRHSHTTCPLCRSSLLSQELLRRFKDMVDSGELEEWVLWLYLSPDSNNGISSL